MWRWEGSRKLSNLKGLKRKYGTTIEWRHPEIGLEKKEWEDVEIIAIERLPRTRGGRAAIGRAVAALVRTALFCFRHHTDAYAEPRHWSEEEAIEAGLSIHEKPDKGQVRMLRPDGKSYDMDDET